MHWNPVKLIFVEKKTFYSDYHYSLGEHMFHFNAIFFLSEFQPGDSFVGYHSDTAAAVVMQLSENPDLCNDEQVGSVDNYCALNLGKFQIYLLVL